MALAVFLRGVNVGGRRTFLPRKVAEELAHLGVVNIGAAGTFVVRRRVARAQLRSELAAKLCFDAKMAICDGREIGELITADPFGDQPVSPDIVRFVSVLCRRPRASPPATWRVPPDGDWLMRVLGREGRFVFGLYRRQMKAIGHLGALDRLYGVPVTTRNWNTIAAVSRVLGYDAS